MRTLVLAVVLSGCSASNNAVPSPAAAPPPTEVPATDAAAESTSPPESDPLSAFRGTWTYATDPTGAIPFDRAYEDSNIRFEDGNRYVFKLGGEGTHTEIGGTWRKVGGEGDEAVLVVDYDNGMSSDPQTYRLRRDEAGEVIGLEIVDDVTPGTFYVRTSP